MKKFYNLGAKTDILDPNHLTLLIVFLEEFFEKVNFVIKSADNKNIKNYPGCSKELKEAFAHMR